MATAVEIVRALIGDIGTPNHFGDPALLVFLEAADDNRYLAAALALKAWAAELSNEINSYRLTDGKQVDKRDQVEAKLKIAANYEERANAGGNVFDIGNSPYVVDDAGQDLTNIETWDDVYPYDQV